jgi:hypothetical protein
MNAVSREILFDILESSMLQSPRDALAWVRHRDEVSGAGTAAEQLARQLRKDLRSEWGGDDSDPSAMLALAKEGLRSVQWRQIAAKLLHLAGGRSKTPADGGEGEDKGEDGV